jgi:ABC-type multidrug transport system fused ATPase/permease subunit
MSHVVLSDRPRVVGVHRTVRKRRLPVAWPLAILLLGYPVWWILGVAPLAWSFLAIPMLFQMYRRRPISFPPMFWIWGLFLALVLISGLMVDVNAPGTIAVSSGIGHYVSYLARFVSYLSVTIVMVYVGNLTETELPRLRLIRWLSSFFVITVVGGLAGTFAPHFTISSPIQQILPASIRANDFVQTYTQVSTAQNQAVLGFPRPSAPFEYANAWGNNFSMLLVWFILGGLVFASFQRRLFSVGVLLVSAIPVVYSQNRGMWIGLVMGVGYLGLRLAMRRRYGVLMGLVLGTVLLGGAVVLSPLQSVITNRIATPQSNDIRGSLSKEAIRVAATSPIVGYGSTRSTIGSNQSLTIGQTTSCPRCGNRVIGSTGQLWLLLVAQGFVGALLYVAFLGQAVVRYWRDQSAVGMAGTYVLILALFYSLFYTAVVSPLAITLLSLGLLWRNAQVRKTGNTSSTGAPARKPVVRRRPQPPVQPARQVQPGQAW